WVAGTVQINGWETLVIDLREKLGVPTGARGRQPVVVVAQMRRDEGPRWLGLIADRAAEIFSLSDDEFRNDATRISGRQKKRSSLDELLWAAELRELLEPVVLASPGAGSGD